MLILKSKFEYSEIPNAFFGNLWILIFFICVLQLFNSCNKSGNSTQITNATPLVVIKTDSLNKLSVDLRKVSADSALRIAGMSIQMAEKADYRKGMADALNNAGIAYFYLGEYDSSVVNNERALSIFSEINDTARYADVLISIGNVYLARTNFSEAQKYYSNALEKFVAVNSKRGISKSLINLSNSYLDQGNYKKSLDLFFKALVVASEIGDLNNQALCYNGIGNVYYYLNDYNNAKENYQKAAVLYENLTDKSKIASIYTSLAMTYSSQQKPDSSLLLLQKALFLANETGHMQLQAEIKNDIGDWFYQNCNYSKALDFYNSSREIYTKLKNNDRLCFTIIGQGLANMKMDSLSIALAYAKEAFNLSKSINDHVLKKEAYKALSEVYEKIHDYKNALLNYKFYKDMADSSLNRENVEKVTALQMEYKFELEQKQMESIQIQKDLKHEAELELIKSRRLWMLVIFIVLTVSIVISFLLYRNRQKTKIERLKVEINKNMQRMLGQQMNPHFIFNTLKSIQSFILKNDAKQSNLFLTRFASLIRTTLENSQSEFINLSAEIESLQLYAQLENLRLNDKFKFFIQVSDSINPQLAKVPSLFFQPYIENAIWHGVSPMDGHGEIKLIISKESDRVRCIIEDNGIGRIASDMIGNSKHKSLGTAITEQRINLLNSLYNTDIQPEIYDISEKNAGLKGTRVEFTLPYISE
jgi:tetratricopeptide (TPR) repeat protein